MGVFRSTIDDRRGTIIQHLAASAGPSECDAESRLLPAK
jgi:hypothetical protein